MNILKHLFLFLIRFYQKILSPDHGIFSKFINKKYCRFLPTCSEYAYQAIEKYGAFKGVYLAFKRIIRCHPWSQGGNDPLK